MKKYLPAPSCIVQCCLLARDFSSTLYNRRGNEGEIQFHSKIEPSASQRGEKKRSVLERNEYIVRITLLQTVTKLYICKSIKMNPGGYRWVKNLSAADKTIYVRKGVFGVNI